MKKNIRKKAIDEKTEAIIATASDGQAVCIAISHNGENIADNADDANTPEVIPEVVTAEQEEQAKPHMRPEDFDGTRQFYPTPPEIAKRMAEKMDLSKIDRLLEPSAGKGNLLDAVKNASKISCYGHEVKKFKGKIDAVEISPELCAILESKGYTTYNENFLEWDCLNIYDGVVMNPPFSEGVHHVLKALRILENGGQLCAILNAETLKNPCTVYRKDLLVKLSEYNAEIEYIQNAFQTAERKTGVEIALIYVNIPEKVYSYGYFAGMDKAHTYFTNDVENSENEETTTELATNDIVDNMVKQYKNEMSATLYIFRHFRQMRKCAPQLSLCTYENGKHEVANIDSIMKKIRLDYWKRLIDTEKVRKTLTHSSLENLRKKLEAFGKYDFNVKNIYKLVIGLSENIVSDIEAAAIRNFDYITYHGSMEKSSNIWLYNGWKTNSAWAINKKIIYQTYGDTFYSTWAPQYHDGYVEFLDELDKILTYFNGGRRPCKKSVLEMLREAHENRPYSGEKIELPFFDVVFYRKGTIHVYFKCPELVKKWNIFAGKRKNFLPNDYGEKKYSDLRKEEKAVADSFEGKTGYVDTHKNYSFYSGQTSAAALIIGSETPEEQPPKTIEASAPTSEKGKKPLQFGIGVKYCYKKSDFIQIIGRDGDKVKFIADGKEHEKEIAIFDGVEVLKNQRGVTLCWANKLHTEPDPPQLKKTTSQKEEQSKPEKEETLEEKAKNSAIWENIQFEKIEDLPDLDEMLTELEETPPLDDLPPLDEPTPETPPEPVEEKQEAKPEIKPKKEESEEDMYDKIYKMSQEKIAFPIYPEGEFYQTGEIYSTLDIICNSGLGDFKKWLKIAQKVDTVQYEKPWAVDKIKNFLILVCENNIPDYVAGSVKNAKQKLALIAPDLAEKPRKIKKSKKKVYISWIDGNPVFRVGDKWEIPETETVPGFTVYVRKLGKSYYAVEEKTGMFFCKTHTLKEMEKELLDPKKADFVKKLYPEHKEKIGKIASIWAGEFSSDWAVLCSMKYEKNSFDDDLEIQIAINDIINSSKKTEIKPKKNKKAKKAA